MERLKLVLQYFQSNSESISNGICIILALVSVKLYTSFDFNCPCLPQYNKLYSLGVMIVPPIILFFLGVLINRHTGVMMDEWMRPVGNRSKNPAVVKWVKYLLTVSYNHMKNNQLSFLDYTMSKYSTCDDQWALQVREYSLWAQLLGSILTISSFYAYFLTPSYTNLSA